MNNATLWLNQERVKTITRFTTNVSHLEQRTKENSLFSHVHQKRWKKCILNLSFTSTLVCFVSHKIHCIRQYLPIFIYELATDMNTLKFETENLLRKGILNQIVSERFCTVYLCMHFPLDVFCQDKKQHNFNTNLFMFWCCKMSSPMNLGVFLAIAIHFTGCILQTKKGCRGRESHCMLQHARLCAIHDKLLLPALQITHKIRS
jgi:hypothetical protein